MTTRANIVTEARRWVGTKYRHQTARHGESCDCYGLVIGTGRHCGMLGGYRPPQTYPAAPDGKWLRRECARVLAPVFSKIVPGMIGSFWYGTRGQPIHLAIFSDYRGLGMIHAAYANQSVCEHRIGSFWATRFVAAYDFPGIE